MIKSRTTDRSQGNDGRSPGRFSRLVRTSFVAAGLLGCSVAGLGWQGSAVGGETESFLAAVETGSLNDELKSSVAQKFQSLIDDGASEKEAVTECLMLAYPEYQKAIAALDSDQVDQGVALLKKLTESSDRFLAADASFFLGRTYLASGQHEQAIDPLSKLTGSLSDQTLRDIESLYYLGTAQAGLLENDKAMDTLIRFLQEDTDSPERLRMGAYSQVVKLQKIRQNTLEDAQSRMEYSQRRLELKEADQATQEQQQKVVSILDTLIEEAQKKECSSNCKGGKCNKKSDSNKPGKKPGESKKPSPKAGKSSGSSNIAAGDAIEQSFDNGPVGIWSQLRDRSRDPANAAVKEKLPPEYRKLIERYYREMSDVEK